jgi:hypothetical protein
MLNYHNNKILNCIETIHSHLSRVFLINNKGSGASVDSNKKMRSIIRVKTVMSQRMDRS